jgi:hypothetical protein
MVSVGKRRSRTSGHVIGKIRKPMAPPIRVEPDEKKYVRAKERARARREREENRR